MSCPLNGPLIELVWLKTPPQFAVGRHPRVLKPSLNQLGGKEPRVNGQSEPEAQKKQNMVS